MARQNARPDAARRRADRVAGRHRGAARGRCGARRLAAPRRRGGRGRPRGAGARAADVRGDRVRVGGQRAPRDGERACASCSPRAVIYSTTTAALLGPVPGAIRFDAPAAGNRPGRHGIWQRPVEARRFKAAPLLCRGARAGWRRRRRRTRTRWSCRCRSRRRAPAGARDIAAITYGANPEKKGLDRVLAAWLRECARGRGARRGGPGRARGRGVARAARRRRRGAAPASRRRSRPAARGAAWRPHAPLAGPPGRRRGAVHRLIPRDEYRALLRRSRVFLTAPRREDYGIAQLEALADGCVLVTTPAPGPYAALPIARALDPGSSGRELAIRTALDDPAARLRRARGRGARAVLAGGGRPRRRRGAAAAPLAGDA